MEDKPSEPLILKINPLYRTTRKPAGPWVIRSNRKHKRVAEEAERISSTPEEPRQVGQKISLIKEYRLLDDYLGSHGGAAGACKSDYDGIERLLTHLIEKNKGSVCQSHTVNESAEMPQAQNELLYHTQRILHAEVAHGPKVRAVMETFPADPREVYLRVEIEEASRDQLRHCANSIPLAYPPIARLLKVVTRITLPEESIYAPCLDPLNKSKTHLVDKNGQVL